MDTWRQDIPSRGYGMCKGPEAVQALLSSWLASRSVGEVMRPGHWGEDYWAEQGQDLTQA